VFDLDVRVASRHVLAVTVGHGDVVGEGVRAELTPVVAGPAGVEDDRRGVVAARSLGVDERLVVGLDRRPRPEAVRGEEPTGGRRPRRESLAGRADRLVPEQVEQRRPVVVEPVVDRRLDGGWQS
jgi:hypothetical protein